MPRVVAPDKPVLDRRRPVDGDLALEGENRRTLTCVVGRAHTQISNDFESGKRCRIPGGPFSQPGLPGRRLRFGILNRL